MKRSRSTISFLAVLLIGLAPILGVQAQGLPATPDPVTAPVGVLAEFEIETLPAPHAEIWFLRFGLDPGGRIPEGSNAGPAVIYVESGTLVVRPDGEVILGASAETTNDQLTLEAGDSVLVPQNVATEELNTSDQPTTFVMLLMYSAMEEDEGETSMEEPVGMTQTGISIGTAEFPPLRATLVMERVVAEPSHSMQNVTLPPQSEGPDPGWMGMDLGTIETGSADLTFEQTSYQNLTWPVMATDQMAQPERVLLTGTTSLDEGESYASYGSVLTFTNNGDQPLTILRVIVSPEYGP